MKASPDNKQPQNSASFHSNAGCCLSQFVLLITAILTCGTTWKLTDFWLRHAYANVEFYRSSESRGAFHILLYALFFSIIPGGVNGVLFFIRNSDFNNYIPWKRGISFLIRSTVLIWLIATVVSFLIVVFYELPNWEVIEGPR